MFWSKIWSRAKFSSNIFRLIQHNFHVRLVYSLFHPTFHSDNLTSKIRTSNFEWLSKTKTVCKIITKNITHIKWAWTAAKKVLTIYLNYNNKMGKNTKMQQKKLAGKKRKVDQWKYTKETEKKKAWFFIIRAYELW